MKVVCKKCRRELCHKCHCATSNVKELDICVGCDTPRAVIKRSAVGDVKARMLRLIETARQELQDKTEARAGAGSDANAGDDGAGSDANAGDDGAGSDANAGDAGARSDANAGDDGAGSDATAGDNGVPESTAEAAQISVPQVFHQMLWGQPAVEDLAKQLVPSVVFVRERSLQKPSPEPADVIAEIQAFVKLVSGSAVRVPVVIITDDYRRARYFGNLPEFHDCIMPYFFGATQQRQKGILKKHTIMALLADASEQYHDRSMLLDVHHTEFFHRVEYTSCMTTPHLDASLVHAYDLMLRFAQKAEEGVGLDLPLVVWEWNMGVEDTKLHVDLALAAKGLGHSYVSLYNGKGQANKQRARMAEKEAEFNACMDVYTQLASLHADDTYTFKHEILLRMHLTKHIPDEAVSYMSSTVGYDVGTLSGFEAQHVTTVEVKKHHVIDGHGVFAKTAIKKNEHVCDTMELSG